MARVLVTGGAGFIGSHTCLLLLERGFDVSVIDSLTNSYSESLDNIRYLYKDKNKFGNKLDFIKGDIRDVKTLNKIFFHAENLNSPIESVIHFAGLKSVKDSISSPIQYWDVNVKGSINLIQVMKQFNCNKIVFSSSATIYGFNDGNLIKETSHINPINPYGVTKLTVENLLNDIFLSQQDQWRIASLRYFNPIGAHPSGKIGENPIGKASNIFPTLLNVAAREINSLKVYGSDWDTPDGTGIRDYIHVMDVADAHVAALNFLNKNSPQYSFFNIGTGIGTSVLELINTFQEVNKVNINHNFCSRREGDLANVIADNNLAISKLDWYPKNNLEDMCKDGWNWKLLNLKNNSYETSNL